MMHKEDTCSDYLPRACTQNNFVTLMTHAASSILSSGIFTPPRTKTLCLG